MENRHGLDRRHGGHGGDRHGRTRRGARDARRAAADDAGASRSAPTRSTTRATGSPRSAGCASRRTSRRYGTDAVGGSAIDGRTTRHAGYAISQRKRKLVEQAFGWMKTVGLLRKLRHRGGRLVDWMFTFGAAGVQPGALAHPACAIGLTMLPSDGFESSR